jgi:4-amino-4-deoxy-L-arabinose transferase-like glycosyltransferase
MAASVSRESPTYDEGNHLYAGYRSLVDGDFGLNPEHPPLVKMVAAAALLPVSPRLPPLEERNFKYEAYLGAKDFLERNDGDALVFRGRIAASTLTLLLALLVFLAAREMFGLPAALLALVLFVFEPNILAHGARVTTDAGVSCFLFAAIYAYYRYAMAPAAARLLVVGAAAGLALASKHSGLLVVPIILLLAVGEAALRLRSRREDGGSRTLRRRVAPILLSPIAVCLVAVAVVWAAYGFRFAARPEGRAMNPPLAEFVQQLGPVESGLISTAADARLLPEAYLYGLADIRRTANYFTSYVLGRPYPHAVWFYFPVALAIKSTLAVLALTGLAFFAVATGRLRGTRGLLVITVAPAVVLGVAMVGPINIGIRHVLPMFAFLAVLGGATGAALWRASARWRLLIVTLVLVHILSSARAFPTYLAYANELWGGPENVSRYLSDSNVDWAQQLKSVRRYVDEHGITDCWFAYTGEGVLDPHAYGIPSRPLPTVGSLWMNERIDAPQVIEGTVFVSATVLSGYQTGPGPLNPYRLFLERRPIAVIDHGVFVYEGRFEIPLASALCHAQRSSALLEAGEQQRAVDEAETAVAIAPDAVPALAALGDALAAAKRTREARVAYERALAIAKSVEPEFQAGPAYVVGQKLAALPKDDGVGTQDREP